MRKLNKVVGACGIAGEQAFRLPAGSEIEFGLQLGAGRNIEELREVRGRRFRHWRKSHAGIEKPVSPVAPVRVLTRSAVI